MDPWHSNLGAKIRQFAAAIADAKPDLSSLEVARTDLVAAAHSIESGDATQGALRLFLACRDLYAAIADAERRQELRAEIREALGRKPTVYLDTVIISAMVKLDLTDAEIASLERILDVFQAGFIELCTSHLAKQELDRIPEPHRRDHVRLFRLIRQAGEVEETPRVSQDARFQEAAALLKESLSETDFNHLTQAIAAKAEFFLTGDRDILRQWTLASELGIAVLSPCGLEAELRRRHLIAPAT